MSQTFSSHHIDLRHEPNASRRAHRTPADLLLPGHIVRFAKRASIQHGEWRDLVEYLVRRYRGRVLRLSSRNANLPFRYQPEGLGLHRVSYVPYASIRAELRMLSYAVRISMCALVVMMLEWERESESGGKRKNAVVPMDFQSCWHLAANTLIIQARLGLRTTGKPPPG